VTATVSGAGAGGQAEAGLHSGGAGGRAALDRTPRRPVTRLA